MAVSKGKLDVVAKRDIGRVVNEMSLSIPLLDANRAGIELYGATNFSAFEVFSPNENTLSRVIAELFDPAGAHGQGLLFINAMLGAVGVPKVNNREAVRSRREVLTRGGRRIDIVVDTPRYVIGIENKPWAIQQTNQLQDYLDELSADLRGRKPLLIFLSDQDEESGQGHVVKVPYYSWDDGASLHSVLNSVKDDIKADRPKDFVADFLAYIGNHFGDVAMTVPSDTPYIDAVEAEFAVAENRKALAAFMMATTKLHWRIVGEIADFLLATVRTEVADDFVPFSDTSIGDCLQERWVPWGLRRPGWPAECQIAVESQRVFFDQIKFGVKAPDGKRLSGDAVVHASPARPSLERLVGQLSGGKKTLYWPWEQPVWDQYWGQEFVGRLVIHSPTGRVSDHPEIQELGRRFVEVALAVDQALSA